MKLFVYPRNTTLIKMYYTYEGMIEYIIRQLGTVWKAIWEGTIDPKRYEHDGDMVPVFKKSTYNLVRSKMQATHHRSRQSKLNRYNKDTKKCNNSD